MSTSTDRPLLLAYVTAATVFIHLLVIPLWAAWLSHDVERAPMPPLKPNCADKPDDRPAPQRPCREGVVCPIKETKARPFRVAVREEPVEEEEDPVKRPEEFVATPVAPKEELKPPPEDTTRAGTQDTRTEKETVAKSNDVGDGGGPRTPSIGAPQPKTTTRPRNAAPPRKGNPDFDEMVAKSEAPIAMPEPVPRPEPRPPDSKEPKRERAKERRGVLDEALADSPFEGATRLDPELESKILGARSGRGGGSPNYLDGVAEDNKTMLNRKRNLYAGFFERVQSNVKRHWDPVTVYRRRDPTGRVYGVQDRLTVLHVTLRGNGEIHQVRVDNPSGLEFLDDEAIRAIRAAGPFPNPPEGLKDINGFIRFRFGFHFEVSSRRSSLFRFR